MGRASLHGLATGPSTGSGRAPGRPRERHGRLGAGRRRWAGLAPASSSPSPPPSGFGLARLARAWRAGACALAAAFVLLLAAAPAAADVLVSNIGQTVNDTHPLASSDRGQAFTTGGHTDGYTLESVEMKFAAAPGGVSVKIVRGRILPGTTVATLTNPSSLAAGNLTFTAPANTVLSANERYFVVVTGSSGRFSQTLSDNEDSGGKSGWRILDSSSFGSLYSLMIRVNGALLDKTAPSFASATVNGTKLTITFDEDLAAAASLANDAFTVKKTPDGGTEVDASLSGSPSISGKTVTLTLATAPVADDAFTVAYSKPTSGSNNKLKDAAGNETDSFGAQMVTNLSPFTLKSASVDGTTVTLVFPSAIDRNSIPAKGSFSVSLAGTAQTPTRVSVDGRTVTLTLATAATPGQAALLTYTKPGSAKPLRDLLGREIKGFANRKVINATGGLSTADAGEDQEVLTGASVTLAGSVSSTRPNPNPTYTYRWTQTDGPALTLATGSSWTSASPTFTAPSVRVDLEFSLVVNDGVQDSEPDTVTVRVRVPPGSNPTSAPCVQPTSGNPSPTSLFEVTETTDSVIKYRSTSTVNFDTLWFCRPDGTREQRATNVGSTHIETVSGLASGTTYWVALTRSSSTGQGLWWNAWKAVTTSGAVSIKRVVFTNAPASGDSYLPGETIRAAVTWSKPVTVDTKGANDNVRLRLDLGPDDADRGNSRHRMPYASGSGTDTLTFEYVVKIGDIDADGVWLQTESATVDLVVAFSNGATIRNGTTDVSNTLAGLPTTGDATRKVDGSTSATAAAGADQEVLTGASVTLSGSGSSTRTGATLTYRWTQTGGAAVTLASGSSWAAATPSFRAPSVRTDLVFALTVNDGAQDSVADTVTVRVRPPPNPTSAPCVHPKPAGATHVDGLALSVTGLANGLLINAGEILASSIDVYLCRPDGTRERLAQNVSGDHNETVSGLASGTTYWATAVMRFSTGVFWDDWLAATTLGAASIKRVAFTSSPASGDSYLLGETIRAAVTWSMPVTVDTKGANDNVRLRLDLGPDDADRGNSRKRMAYASGSGTDTLTFEYVVKPGDMDADGVWLQTESATDKTAVFLANGATLKNGTTDVARTRSGLTTTGDAGRKVDGTSTATAAAGADQEVEYRASVTLSGSGSSTRSNPTYTYAWTQTAGAAVTLRGATTASPTFTAPAVRTDLVFSLTVNDGAQDSGPDTVTVRVRPPPNPTNAPCVHPKPAGEAFTAGGLFSGITVTDSSISFRGGGGGSSRHSFWFCRPDGTRSTLAQGVDDAHTETVSNLASGTTYWVALRRTCNTCPTGGEWYRWNVITTTGAASIKRVAFTSSPASGDSYLPGETIRAAVTWSKPVTVDTKGANVNVRLRLDLGPDDADRGNSRHRMPYASGSGTDTLTFEYVVKIGDIDADGVWLQTESATVDLVVAFSNGATIRNGTTDVSNTLAGLPTTGDATRKVDGSTSATAAAGADQEVLTGASVTLSGSGSSTRTGATLTYRWTQSSGAGPQLTQATGNPGSASG